MGSEQLQCVSNVFSWGLFFCLFVLFLLIAIIILTIVLLLSLLLYFILIINCSHLNLRVLPLFYFDPPVGAYLLPGIKP